MIGLSIKIYNRYYLEQLDIKASDFDNLSDNDKKRLLRAQWIHKCTHAESSWAADHCTTIYHSLISDVEENHPIHTHIVQFDYNVSHTAFSLLQREQIENRYADLLEAYSQLASDNDKQLFAAQNAPFLCLAQSLQKNQHHVYLSLGNYLYLTQQETLSTRITQQWRLQIIRLFAREGLDDFQYRYALSTGELEAILAPDKLYSPVKIAVAVLNSLILVITTTFNYILNLNVAFKILFFLFINHPVANLMIQLPRIARLLEIIACPNTQIIRPLCVYTQWSHLSISILLSAAGLSILYSVMYTTILAQIAVILPYITTLLYAYILYFVVKNCIYLFRESWLSGSVTVLTMALMFGLQFYIGRSLSSAQSAPSPLSTTQQQWGTILRLFAIISFATGSMRQDNSLAIEMLPLPLPGESIPQDIADIATLSYNKAHLSHTFFNTPKDAQPIRQPFHLEEPLRMIVQI